MKKNRLRAAAMIAAMTIVFGLARSEAQETVLRIGVNLTTSDADPFYAQDVGLFRRAGLNVTIQSLSGGAAIASAVASGDLDIGVSNMLSLGNAVARGIPIKAIAPGYLYDTNVPLSRVVVAPNGPIHTAKDLNGKVVCGLSVGGMDQLGINAWIDKNGGDSTTVRYIEIPGGAVADALDAGRVAGCTIGEPYGSDGLSSGRLRPIGKTYDAVAPSFMMVAYFATDTWLAKNPAVAKKYFDVMAEASVWASTHPEEAAAITRKYMKTNITRVHEKPSRTLAPELLQPVFDLAAKYKLTPRLVNASELVWSGATQQR